MAEIRVSISDELKTTFQEAAKRCGLSLSAWIRLQAVKSLPSLAALDQAPGDLGYGSVANHHLVAISEPIILPRDHVQGQLVEFEEEEELKTMKEIGQDLLKRFGTTARSADCQKDVDWGA